MKPWPPAYRMQTPRAGRTCASIRPMASLSKMRRTAVATTCAPMEKPLFRLVPKAAFSTPQLPPVLSIKETHNAGLTTALDRMMGPLWPTSPTAPCSMCAPTIRLLLKNVPKEAILRVITGVVFPALAPQSHHAMIPQPLPLNLVLRRQRNLRHPAIAVILRTQTSFPMKKTVASTSSALMVSWWPRIAARVTCSMLTSVFVKLMLTTLAVWRSVRMAKQKWIPRTAPSTSSVKVATGLPFPVIVAVILMKL